MLDRAVVENSPALAAALAVMSAGKSSADEAGDGPTATRKPYEPRPSQTSRPRKEARRQASVRSKPTRRTPAAPVTEIPGAIALPSTTRPVPQETLSAPAEADDGHSKAATHSAPAIVGEITAVMRRYNDLRRAKQRLLLQAIATCRIACDGDKEAAAKLFAKPTPEIIAWLVPYMDAMAPLDHAIAEQAKLLEKLGKSLPVYEWCKSVPGLGPRFLSMIVGECGIGPGEYRSVSALWKRMGMAVIDGERQRRVTGDAALVHGYVATRRSLMWNIGGSIMKAQIRGEKDDDGKKIEGGSRAIGEYGQLYLDRKAYELERSNAGAYAEVAAALVKSAKREGKTPNAHNLEGRLSPSHLNNRAKRYIEKRLLRELWKAWRRASSRADTSTKPPASNPIPAGEV